MKRHRSGTSPRHHETEGAEHGDTSETDVIDPPDNAGMVTHEEAADGTSPQPAETSPLAVNQTVIYPQITPGIARRIDIDPTLAPETEAGGGDANGTAAKFLHGQSGTGADKLSLPRLSNGGAFNHWS
jgi:hypothetical protein